MDDYVLALEITVIALVTLMIISLFFIGLSRALQWIAKAGRKDKGEDSG